MIKFFKKEEKVKTLFDNVSAIEAKPIIDSLIDDFMIIVGSDNMQKCIKECFDFPNIPENKTPKQWFEEQGGNERISRFLKAIMDYAYEPILRILSKCFCAPYDEYCKKTLNEISKDLLKFAKSPFFSLFMSAVMSARVR